MFALLIGWGFGVAVGHSNRAGPTDVDPRQKYGFATRRARDFEALASAGDEPPNAVPRVQAKGLSVEEFSERYEKRGLPCLLQGIPELEGWPAWEGWAADKLCERFADVPFKVGKADDGQPIRLKLRFFAKYLQRQMDDSPLYVFDNRFGGRTDVREELLKEYAVPSYFPDDYMAVAGEEGRPPYRWVAVGPKRSGTVMHQDPLCTNAWNTLLQGRKRWVLLDPGVPRAVAKASLASHWGSEIAGVRPEGLRRRTSAAISRRCPQNGEATNLETTTHMSNVSLHRYAVC